MSGLARIITSAAIGGLVLGGVVGFFSASDPEPATLALDAVPVYLCPGEGEVGTLHRGDRVLITGRSGDWLAVRNVRGSGERVFIRNAAIVPDSALDGLPEVDCDPVGNLAVATTVTTEAGEQTTTTTTEAPEDTTTTSSSSTTSTTSTTAATTTTSSTTTTAPDTTPPTIANAFASDSMIWEATEDCEGDEFDKVSTVNAFVTDDRGLGSVELRWQFSGDDPMSVAMLASGSNYTANFGPFPADQLAGDSEAVTVTIRVVDMAGNVATEQVVVTLTDCDTFG